MTYVSYVLMAIAFVAWLMLLPYVYRLVMVTAWGLRANALAVKGKHAEALAAYDKGLRYLSTHVGLLYGRGVALRKLGRDHEAMDCYRQVAQHHPRHYRAHYNLGILLRERGEFSEAEREFLRAIEIRPDYAKAHCNLAILYDKLGNPRKALEYYVKYFICGGSDPLVRNRMRQLGRHERQEAAGGEGRKPA